MVGGWLPSRGNGHVGRRGGDGALPAQQLEGVDVDEFGDAFQRPERQVALTALQAAHVGAVDANEVGEGLLRQAELPPVEPEVAADSPLEITFHDGGRR